MSKKKSFQTQLFEYFVSGGAFFWSGYAAFPLFYSVLHWPLFVAKQLANVIGLSVNYLLEDRWVFNEKTRKTLQRRRTGRYLLLTFVNFGIDYLIVAGLKSVGLSPYLGQFVSAGFFTVWNFIWYKYWVFAPTATKSKKGRA